MAQDAHLIISDAFPDCSGTCHNLGIAQANDSLYVNTLVGDLPALHYSCTGHVGFLFECLSKRPFE